MNRKELQEALRELHDELGQSLTVLTMDVAWLERSLEPEGRVPEPVGDRLRKMRGTLDAMIGSVRRISAELRPAMLDQLGLPATVDWHATEFSERTGIACSVRSQVGEGPLPGPVTTALYRILQECLTNVARHAKASMVEITLERVDGDVALSVRDDGRGILEEAIGSPRSLGLLGMQERCRAVGGALSILRRPDQGTLIQVRIPVAGGVTSPPTRMAGVS